MHEELIIFGAGMWGKSLAFLLKRKGVHIKVFFDNSQDKAGSVIWGDIPCMLPRLLNEHIPVVIAVENEAMQREIQMKCCCLGYGQVSPADIDELKKEVADLPDREYLELQYYLRMEKLLNLNSPQLFNEKIQWLKLYDRRPRYHDLVDKYEVKKIIGAIIGEEHIIPTVGIWDTFDEIDFEALPDSFVLKCTHDSGSTVICQDKYRFGLSEAREKLEFCRKRDYYSLSREWVYKDVKPRIIAEEYLSDEDLLDYKIFIFGGQAKLIQVDYNRFADHHRNFYSSDWEYIPFTTCYPTNPLHKIEKPKYLAKLLEYAEILAINSGNPPFLRCDFYIIKDHILFGEMTFYHGAGYEKFFPAEWDKTLGDWITLPESN